MGELDWQKLIEEHDAWVAYNFPDPTGERTPLDSFLGCIEELGELTHHHLKQAQSIRGDDRYHEDEARDAVGDYTVYLLGVMSFVGVVPEPGWEDRFANTTGLTTDIKLVHLARSIGALGRDVLLFTDPSTLNLYESAQLRGKITYQVALLSEYCLDRGWDYSLIVQETWDSVKQRDWIKYPDTGRPPVTA